MNDTETKCYFKIRRGLGFIKPQWLASFKYLALQLYILIKLNKQLEFTAELINLELLNNYFSSCYIVHKCGDIN